jgi:hypothetical protein
MRLTALEVVTKASLVERRAGRRVDAVPGEDARGDGDDGDDRGIGLVPKRAVDAVARAIGGLIFGIEPALGLGADDGRGGGGLVRDAGKERRLAVLRGLGETISPGISWPGRLEPTSELVKLSTR